MNACGRARHVLPDVDDCVLLNCQREHVRENGHGCVHGYELSQNRGHADGYAGADVRVNLSWCSSHLPGLRLNTMKAYHSGCHWATFSN